MLAFIIGLVIGACVGHILHPVITAVINKLKDRFSAY